MQGLVGRTFAEGDHSQLGVERLLGLDDRPSLHTNNAGHFQAGVVHVNAHGVVYQRGYLLRRFL